MHSGSHRIQDANGKIIAGGISLVADLALMAAAPRLRNERDELLRAAQELLETLEQEGNPWGGPAQQLSLLLEKIEQPPVTNEEKTEE